MQKVNAGRKTGRKDTSEIAAHRSNFGDFQRFSSETKADDGTRTHDLLHGKSARYLATMRATCSDRLVSTARRSLRLSPLHGVETQAKREHGNPCARRTIS